MFCVKEKSSYKSDGNEDKIKLLEDVGDSDPMSMVVFSWILIIVGKPRTRLDILQGQALIRGVKKLLSRGVC